MTITLPVTLRDKTTAVDTLRASGSLPAVIYGPKQEPISVSLDVKEFEKVFKEAGEATIIELTGLDKKIEVFVKDVDFNPTRNEMLHVDLYAVEQGKEMTAHVPLHFIGEAPAEESKLGTVTKVLHEVEITCMPNVMPSHIDVDLSVLVAADSKIHVKDLTVATGVTIEAESEESVAVITATKSSGHAEEDESTAVDMDSIEVEKKGKEEVAE